MTSDRIIDHATLPVASLCLFGVALEPSVISREMKCDPNYAQRNGDSFLSPSGERRQAATGLWMLDSDRFSSSPDIAEHIKALLAVLDVGVDLRRLPGVDIAEVKIAVLSGEQPEIVMLTRRHDRSVCEVWAYPLPY